ncbi:MAG: pyruvate kinase [Alphaproteobacteria bacterium]|nr:pyruvate kinase [Alphaproteobacteria bacterium]
MKKLTKITSSIGPKSESREVLTNMIRAGVNICRLNFSHDTGDVQGAKIDMIREISNELDTPVAVLVDLQGPKHRIGNFETEDKFPIEPGQKFVFDTDPTPGNSQRVQLPDADVMKSLGAGDRILLNDGKIEMRVDAVSADKIEATVIRGTEIWSRRGFNLPDTEVATSVLTAKDRVDLDYAVTKNPDWVAISFVQKPEDVIEVREFIKARTSRPIKIIAKIERPNAVERISEIIAVADAIMVARGDLAVEVPFEKVPAITRHIVRECRAMNKPVIIATQMLGSMVNSDFPTRAEISDVATAAYLRADSTMTSEETTISNNPAFVAETMAKILAYSDADAIENECVEGCVIDDTVENDWSYSVASVAGLNNAAAIVVFAADCDAAMQISCRRPDMPIVAVCKEQVIASQLCISRGVMPVLNAEMFDKRDAFAAARRCGIDAGKLVVVDGEEISLRTIK